MAPEILHGQLYNHRADLWSLGCVLYELCTLEKAFNDHSQIALMCAIAMGQYKPITFDRHNIVSQCVRDLILVNPLERILAGKIKERISNGYQLPTTRRQMQQASGSSFERGESIRSRSQLQHVGSNDFNNAWILEGNQQQHQPISAFQGSMDPCPSALLYGGHQQPYVSDDVDHPPAIAHNNGASETQQSFARPRSSQMRDTWNIGAKSPQSGYSLNEVASRIQPNPSERITPITQPIPPVSTVDRGNDSSDDDYYGNNRFICLMTVSRILPEPPIHPISQPVDPIPQLSDSLYDSKYDSSGDDVDEVRRRMYEYEFGEDDANNQTFDYRCKVDLFEEQNDEGNSPTNDNGDDAEDSPDTLCDNSGNEFEEQNHDNVEEEIRNSDCQNDSNYGFDNYEDILIDRCQILASMIDDAYSFGVSYD